MKLKYTLAALAATALAANAATSFHNLAGSANNQASFGDVAGITFTVGILGADTNLGSIDLDGRSSGALTDLVSFTVYVDADNDASTWGLGAVLGSSAESQALATGTNSFIFSGITLAANTVYTVVVVNDTVATNDVGFGLVNGNSDAGTRIFQNDGADAFSGSHEAAITVNMNAVPEPSSTALLGLGGLALILRRRK